MDTYESKIRLRVLEDSLELEAFVTHWLRIFLDIDSKNSKTLGNSSSAISLNNKLNLLIDLGVLDPDERTHFLNFMAIRNQFMHNREASTFIKCFGCIDGLGNWLRKQYGVDSSLSEEEQCLNWYKRLSVEVLSSAVEIVNRAIQVGDERAIFKKNAKIVEFCEKEVPKLIKAIQSENLSDEMLDKLETFIEGFAARVLEHPIRKKYE